MGEYYAERLSADRLRRCYDLATPAVRRFLEAEIEFVLARITPGDRVLDLGCGYGRVTSRLLEVTERVVGVDTSPASLAAAGEDRACTAARFARMNAARLAFAADTFDVVLCLQNGISAFHEDPLTLLAEAIRVTAPGGRIFFATYAESFWEERLAWFEIQARHGLVGEIDRERTGAGRIVCRDGFTATTTTPEEFVSWGGELGFVPRLTEVEGSSLICELIGA